MLDSTAYIHTRLRRYFAMGLRHMNARNTLTIHIQRFNNNLQRRRCACSHQAR